MSVITMETPDGPGELVLDPADEPGAVLLLGHGAGGDITGWDLKLIADRLPALGVSVVRFRQPYRVAGRKVFSSKPGLDRAWQLALAQVSGRWPELPLFCGGHSAGARTACRGFAEPQRGLVLLSFPLHPPGKADKSRIVELTSVTAPTLLLQGSKDSFGTPSELQAALLAARRPDIRLVELAQAGHSLAPAAKLAAVELDQRERLVIWSIAGFISAQIDAAA